MAEKRGYNRRDFLKIVGAGAGMAASGCGKKLPEKFIPYVVQPDEVIPGVSTWYASRCGECSAGCGVLIRTREGRALKVEGNPHHPINRGGLCAHGQSTLQSLYDPDRIREPIKRDVGGAFAPIGWKDAIDSFAQAVADAGTANAEVILLTGPTSGSEAALIEELSKKIPALKHYQYEFAGSDAVDLAAEKVFGAGMRTSFDFSKAKTIVGFGADYLETWISPVEFSRGWAEGRRLNSEKKVSRVIHVEPRLSLTAANADRWIMNAPGSENAIMLALLKAVSAKKGGGSSAVASLVSATEPNALLEGSGLSVKDVEAIADELIANGPSLVVAGGASVSGDRGVSGAVLANLLNAALGNVGTTVKVQRSNKKAALTYGGLTAMLNDIAEKKRKVGVMIVSGVNPAYTMPRQAKFKAALSQIPTLVSVSTHSDETTELATLILPMSHCFESWSDSEPRPGVFNLGQPAMQPLYKTQSLGDTLISLAASSKLKDAKLENITSFYDYIKAKWKARTGEGGFDSRWLDYVEKGGDWSKAVEAGSGSVSIAAADLKDLVPASKPKASGTFALLAYPTVNSFDGSSANRPWMQELPNPMTSAVWGSWVEAHPETAAGLGLKTGDVVQVFGEHGYIEAPLYITKYIHPQLLAVPLGQGHESFGRFANGIGANVLSMLPPDAAKESLQMLTSGVKVRTATLGKERLVMLQGSDSQYKRGIGRVVTLAALNEHGHAEENEKVHEEGHGEEEDPLALGPREEPHGMYQQMQHSQLVYKWGMNVDLSTCTGCAACVVACYAENNVPVVGKTVCDEGREMSWIRIERYLDGPPERPVEGFVPMMCQHCDNAPCEPVCPVYATYHTEEGLNSMVYNRCVGTRYCLNNCSYKVRRFNWYKYAWPEPMNWQLNPDVTVREVGVMEKCTFCVQRIREAQGNAKDLGRLVQDGEIQPACASSCATGAITFGNLLDKKSRVAELSEDPRVYKVLDVALNTQPSVTYLAKVVNDGESAA